MSADDFTHAFKTFMGLPPAKGEAPVCGAVLTDAYDFPGVERPVCPQCQAVMTPPDQVPYTIPDSRGNRVRVEGCDRCYCGCKYWENDRCIDCGGTEIQPTD